MNRKHVGISAVVIVSAGLLISPQPAAAAPCAAAAPAVAHRGGTERYVENTRNAFRDAANRGVLLWETDVRFTADDVPVLLHDDTLDRTTDATGPVAAVTWAGLSSARTADGQPLMTLGELVNDAQVDGATLFVELKTNPTPAEWDVVGSALRSRAGVLGRTTLSSFDGPTLLEAHSELPGVPTALIQSTGWVEPSTVTPYGDSLFKHKDSITSARMAAWSGPLDVQAWTVDDAATWERMTWYPKLTGVHTNRPAAYVAWQKARVC